MMFGCNKCTLSPCPPQCPDYTDTRQSVGNCPVCSCEILTGDELFRIGNEMIHADCVQRFTPEEVFDLLEISVSQPFKNSDIDGSAFLEAFGIEKERA